ncbi:MAG: hypothetical protein M1819_005630 [Sarea resinae]|nr:MAG: hypothetical protein M1819_005630 [Sarea resinae]
MSLESALDEERREILKLLEGTQNRPRVSQSPQAPASFGPQGRTASPAGARSPVRSMLDIGNSSPVRSMLDVGDVPLRTGSATGGAPPTVRSLLDPMGPPRRHRADGADEPGLYRTRSEPSVEPSHHHFPAPDRGPNAEYQFEMLPSVPSHIPKRVTQGGKKPKKDRDTMPSSLSSVLERAGDLGWTGAQDRGRALSPAGIGRGSKSKSKSPTPRSKSPNLNPNSFTPLPVSGTFVSDDGLQTFDMTSAYRRLSDAALLRSGGSLSMLPHHERADSGEALGPSGGVRLQKDYYDDNGENVVDSSDEESESGDEGRGRRKTRKAKSSGEDQGESEDSDGEDEPEGPVGMGKKKKRTKAAKSLLAAAEEERQRLSKTYKVKSLLDPLDAEAPTERMANKKAGVHPNTSFDQNASGISTPVSSDTEADLTDIRRAQRLNVSMSPITSTPESHRVIRTIIRGEFSKMQQEAEEGLRRQRTYLVATDLSEEAAHALEWTIGTVLRDGDTLLAVYAIDEAEVATKGSENDPQGVGIGEAVSSMADSVAAVRNFTTLAASAVEHGGHGSSASPLATMTSADPSMSSHSPDTRGMSRAEQERRHAAEDISQRCVKLLRKTRLQVRVVIEVIHCKSPKHLITEVIDFIEPTLVILGSRGRSALKGVLLGSFSNYLVTKSSVPVMVARKRLRTHSKYKKTNIRLSNNLTNPKGLAAAKID